MPTGGSSSPQVHAKQNGGLMALGADIGYIRVSSADQNTSRQLTDIHLDKVFEDHIGGNCRNRPGLDACLEYLREGDTLHVHSIDRLARNLLHLQQLVDSLTTRGVTIVFHKENIRFSPEGQGSSDPMSRLMMQMLGAFAEFERSLIRERQREGIAAAKSSGKLLGRPKRVSDEVIEQVRRDVEIGIPLARIAKKIGVPRTTLHSRLYVVKHGRH